MDIPPLEVSPELRAQVTARTEAARRALVRTSSGLRSRAGTPRTPSVETVVAPQAQPVMRPIDSSTALRSRSAAKRCGQVLPLLSLAVAGVSGVMIGLGFFLALDSIGLSARQMLEARDWLTLALMGMFVGVLSFVGGVVSAIRSRPRITAALAIIGAVFIPVVGLVMGITAGADAVSGHAANLMMGSSGSIGDSMHAVASGQFGLRDVIALVVAILG